MFLYLSEKQFVPLRLRFFLPKKYGIFKNYAYLCSAKHKVFEEFLKLSCPENTVWIFLERRPQSFAPILLHSSKNSGNRGSNKFSFNWIA